MPEKAARGTPTSLWRSIGAEQRLYAAKLVAIAAVYYGAAKLGLSLAFATPSVTAVWPPTGIALAALVLWGYRFWPGVALGAFLANSWTGVPIYAVLGITVGNTLEALVGAYLLRRFAGFHPSLERVRDVIALAVAGGVVSTCIAATVGVTSLIVGGEIAADSFGSVWRTWWLGDMGGDLVVAAALMVAATHWPFRRAPGRPVEALVLGVLIVGLTSLVFSGSSRLPYVIFPALVWAALRFWQPGAVAATLLVASIAIPLTEHNMGPFSGNSPDDRLLLAQTFVGVAGLTALILAAVTTERRRVEEAARYIAETLQEGLLPPHPPDVPDIDTAVEFHPAGARELVGGDFYDWFESSPGTWDVFVGDVAGKGAAAARTTALARYTLRAEAAHEAQPRGILKLLNDALRRQAPGETCTVASARLPPSRTARRRIALALGGHPRPLVLRIDGRVEEVGERGVVLGAIANPPEADQALELAPGDAMVLYTDGLTDAYAPERIVGPTELAAAVGACHGRDAREIARGIHEKLIDGDTAPRDDVVVLVLRVLGPPEPQPS